MAKLLPIKDFVAMFLYETDMSNKTIFVRAPGSTMLWLTLDKVRLLDLNVTNYDVIYDDNYTTSVFIEEIRLSTDKTKEPTDDLPF